MLECISLEKPSQRMVHAYTPKCIGLGVNGTSNVQGNGVVVICKAPQGVRLLRNDARRDADLRDTATSPGRITVPYRPELAGMPNDRLVQRRRRVVF